MKRYRLQWASLLSASMLSMNVFAHGDHSMVTPDHGMEHAVWYGIGIVAVLLLVKLGKALFRQRNK